MPVSTTVTSAPSHRPAPAARLLDALGAGAGESHLDATWREALDDARAKLATTPESPYKKDRPFYEDLRGVLTGDATPVYDAALRLSGAELSKALAPVFGPLVEVRLPGARAERVEQPGGGGGALRAQTSPVHPDGAPLLQQLAEELVEAVEGRRDVAPAVLREPDARAEDPLQEHRELARRPAVDELGEDRPAQRRGLLLVEHARVGGEARGDGVALEEREREAVDRAHRRAVDARRLRREPLGEEAGAEALLELGGGGLGEGDGGDAVDGRTGDDAGGDGLDDAVRLPGAGAGGDERRGLHRAGPLASGPPFTGFARHEPPCPGFARHGSISARRLTLGFEHGITPRRGSAASVDGDGGRLKLRVLP